MSSDIGVDCPWLAAPWRRLYAYLTAGRLPPALLLSGRRGLGKTRLARTFAQRLLCRNASGEFPCGLCDGCRLVTAGTHPDLLPIEPEEAGKPIRVEAIRETIVRLSLRPHFGGRRVVLLAPAEMMNRHAANSVLKSLEEPDAATVFLLVTETPEALPVTVRSRCQQIAVAAPSRAELIAWLATRGATDQAETLCAIARDAPLRTLELLDTDAVTRHREVLDGWIGIAGGRVDPVAVAASWEKVAHDAVHWIAGWTEDLIRIRSAPDRPCRNLTGGQEVLRKLALRLESRQLFGYLDRLGLAKQSLLGQINRQLLMEELAIRWSRLAAKS